MAPMQRPMRRSYSSSSDMTSTVSQSFLRQSSVTDSIGQTVPDTRCTSSKGTVAERRVHSEHFQHLTTSTTCPRTTATSPVGDFSWKDMTSIEEVIKRCQQDTTTIHQPTSPSMFGSRRTVSVPLSITLWCRIETKF